MLSAIVRTCRTVLPLTVIVACSDPSGPRSLPRGVDIRTSSNVVPVQKVDGMRRATITAKITNDSDQTVYYSYCSEGISVRDGGSWNNVWRPVCMAILLPPEPIAPGQTKALTLYIDENDYRPGLVTLLDPDRTFRLDVQLLTARAPYSDKFVAIDPDKSVSNSFRFAE